MKRWITALALVSLGAGFAQVAAPRLGVRFTSVDVYAAAGAKQLAAYQVEVTCSSPGARIVGVEGGEPAPFRKAPYYDPSALEGGRIVIAAFTTEDGAPAGRVRVARLHMAETAEGPAPEYQANLVAAAAVGGEKIEVKVELVRNGGE